MSDVRVLHVSQLTPTCFQAAQPKRNAKGGLRIDINYQDPNMVNQVYLLQTPRLRLPFGLGVQEHESGASSYSLPLSFDNYRNTADSTESEFLQGIQRVEAHVKALAASNSAVWFKKPMKLEVIDELFRPSLKYSEEWPPLFKCKLPYWQGRFACDIYDNRRQKSTVDIIQQNATCICLIQLTNLWFVDKQFGCTWMVKQCQVFPSVSFETFLIQPGEGEEDSSADAKMIEDSD